MAKWYAMPKSFSMTEREYRANITGMNIVFGAVLGFVLADSRDLPQMDFAVLLLLSATAVVTILYLGSSRYKLFYAITALVMVAFLPGILSQGLEIASIPQLQPTLAVWTFMVLLVEIMPREKEIEKIEETDE